MKGSIYMKYVLQCIEGEKNTWRGLNCVRFFFKTKYNVKSLIKFRVWDIVQSLMQRISKKEREEKDTKQLYRFLHNPEVVLSPLHFEGEFTKINIWLQLLKHKSKRLQTTHAQNQEVSYA